MGDDPDPLRSAVQQADEDSDPLRVSILKVLLEHRGDYSLLEMEMALQSEAQEMRKMTSTTERDEDYA